MTFRKCLWVFALLLSGWGVAAQAQLAVYGEITGERLNGITCLDPQHVCAESNGTVRPYGATFGGYYDFRTYGPVRVGFDVRGDVLSSNKSAYAYAGGTQYTRQYDVLGGVRGTYNSRYKFILPYAQISFGYAKTNATQPTPLTYVNFSRLQGNVGLDVPLGRNLDFRVIELGVGTLFGSGSHSTQSIGAGLVFHMARDDRR